MNLFHTRLSVVFILILFFTNGATLKAQKTMNDYNSQWQKVEEFQKKGLTRSALSEVENIYRAATKSNNDPQIIKALLFKINLQQNIQEDASEKIIDSFEIETAKAKDPARSILQSITAQLYYNYFEQNRYKIYGRTNTTLFDKKDIATWTADDFHQKISELYLSSLE